MVSKWLVLFTLSVSNFLKNEEEIGNKFQDVTTEPHLLPGTIQHASSQATAA